MATPPQPSGKEEPCSDRSTVAVGESPAVGAEGRPRLAPLAPAPVPVTNQVIPVATASSALKPVRNAPPRMDRLPSQVMVEGADEHLFVAVDGAALRRLGVALALALALWVAWTAGMAAADWGYCDSNERAACHCDALSGAAVKSALRAIWPYLCFYLNTAVILRRVLGLQRRWAALLVAASTAMNLAANAALTALAAERRGILLHFAFLLLCYVFARRARGHLGATLATPVVIFNAGGLVLNSMVALVIPEVASWGSGWERATQVAFPLVLSVVKMVMTMVMKRSAGVRMWPDASLTALAASLCVGLESMRLAVLVTIADDSVVAVNLAIGVALDVLERNIVGKLLFNAVCRGRSSHSRFEAMYLGSKMLFAYMPLVVLLVVDVFDFFPWSQLREACDGDAAGTPVLRTARIFTHRPLLALSVLAAALVADGLVALSAHVTGKSRGKLALPRHWDEVGTLWLALAFHTLMGLAIAGIMLKASGRA